MNTDKAQIKTAEKLDWLIEQRCERRELRPLKYLPPIYSGTPVHADQIGQLPESLQDIKGWCREKLTTEELGCVIAASNETEDVFEKMIATDNIGFNARPHPALSPGRGFSPGPFSVIRPAVRPIQRLVLPKTLKPFLPLLGERAGVRASNQTNFAFSAFARGDN